jgi:hypothetical protein
MIYKFFNMSRRAWNKFYSRVFDSILRHALDDYKNNVTGRMGCVETIVHGVENAAADALNILLKMKPECFTTELEGKTVFTVDRLFVYNTTHSWVRCTVSFHRSERSNFWLPCVRTSDLGNDAVPEACALTSNLVAPRFNMSAKKLASIVAKFAEAHVERNANLVKRGYTAEPWP